MYFSILTFLKLDLVIVCFFDDPKRRKAYARKAYARKAYARKAISATLLVLK